MKRRWPWLAALALATLSCQVILGLHEPVGHDAVVPEAAPPPPGDPCNHAEPPAKPAKDDDPTTKKTFWFASQHIVLPLRPDAGVQPGFDLDQSCTCEPDLRDGAAPCRTPSSTPVFCDYDGGVDDGFGKVASNLPSFVDPVGPANKALTDGTRSLLLYLADYNDLANDTDVSVQFVDSGGLYTTLGCNNEDRGNAVTFIDPDAPAATATRYLPLFDGCDRWSPNVQETIGTYPNRQPTQTLAGYVSNYTVVVPFKDLGASVFGGTSTISNGIAIAQISKDEKGIHHADGLLSGRAKFSDLLDLIGRVPIDTSGSDASTAFCDTPFWPVIASAACNARDTMVSPAEEFQGETCDGTTLVFAVTLVEAQVSDVEFSNPTPGAPCDNSTVTCQ